MAEMANVDVSAQPNDEATREFHQAMVSDLHWVTPAQQSDLIAGLTDDGAGYSKDAIKQANLLLDHLKDQGYHFEPIARRDGGGVLLKLRNGSANLTVTLIAPDRYRADDSISNGANYIGNVYTGNNTPFYFYHNANQDRGIDRSVDRINEQRRDNPDFVPIVRASRDYALIDALLGKLPERAEMHTEPAREGSRSDSLITITYDDTDYERVYAKVPNFDKLTNREKRQYQNKQIYHFGRSVRDVDTVQQTANALDQITPEELDAWKEDGLTPLAQLAIATNFLISQGDNQTHDGRVRLTDEQEYEVMDIDSETLAGINFDTLAAYNDRSVIQKALNEELAAGRDLDLFTLSTVVDENGIPTGEMDEPFTGAPGLKNLLIEGTAGIKATKVEENELPAEYQAFLAQFREDLVAQGVRIPASQKGNVYFDSDNVIHYKGYYGKDGHEVSGLVGQVFLPNADHVIKTSFVASENSPDDRNYEMVPGYTGYYSSDEFKQVPVTFETTKVMMGDQEVEVLADSTGKPWQQADEAMVPVAEMNQILAQPNGYDNWLWQMQQKAQAAGHGPLEEPAYKTTKTEPTSIRDRLRLQGFNVDLRNKVNGTLATQLIQGDIGPGDNVALNKVYHGDVYAMRLQAGAKDRAGVVATLANRVHFDEDVMNMDAKELGFKSIGTDPKGKPIYPDKTHRDVLPELVGIIDPADSSDGKALGQVGYLTSAAVVLPDMTVVAPKGAEGRAARTPITEQMPYHEGDPEDRTMMGANQMMTARKIAYGSNVALMTYKGYTFEDGAVISKDFAFAHGHDDIDGKRQPMVIGDKISDTHGNKATVSYIADPDDPKDRLFKENPELDVIMNPHSIPTRFNTGVVIEMQRGKTGINDVTLDGQKVGERGQLDVIVTDITAEGKTHIYDADSERKGRSFGNQEGWVAQGQGLSEVAKEVFAHNDKAFNDMMTYARVAGVDIDDKGVIILGTGAKESKGQLPLDMNGNPIAAERIVEPSDDLRLPDEGGFMRLPTRVKLPSGKETEWLPVLDSAHRRTQELYDGTLMQHEYSQGYRAIAQAANDYNKLLDAGEYSDRDLTNAQAKMQNQVDGLTNRIVDDKLGGVQREGHKDAQAVKRSIAKRKLLGTQVDHSATAILTNDPSVKIDTLRVSPAIMDQMNLKDPDQDMALMWRDPAIGEGSMRSFKVEVDPRLTGVAINPLMTETFGADFDGDTVAMYAPQSRSAQQEIQAKAGIAQHLFKPDGSFAGNVSQDLVSASLRAKMIGPDISEQSPLYQRDDELVKLPGSDKEQRLGDLKPKDQITFLLAEQAKQPDGVDRVNDVWQKTVYSDKNNIGASKIDLQSRQAFLDSVLAMAKSGAKGKVAAIYSSNDERRTKLAAAMSKQQGREISPSDLYPAQMQKGIVDAHTTTMGYYDRGVLMADLKERAIAAAPEANLTLQSVEKSIESGQLDVLKKNKPGIKSPDALLKAYNQVASDRVGGVRHDQAEVRGAIAGKVDLTGQAGTVSQGLLRLAIEDPKSTRAVLACTEGITQSPISLKHDAGKVPEVRRGLRDLRDLLNKEPGAQNKEFATGKTYEAFHQAFNKIHETLAGDSLPQELTKPVFDLISKKDESGKMVTQPVAEAALAKESPIQSVAYDGFTAFKNLADANTAEIKKIAKKSDYQPKVRRINEGNYSKYLTPRKLRDDGFDVVTRTRDYVQQRQAQAALAKHRDEIQQWQARDAMPSVDRKPMETSVVGPEL